jgi:hypothetical protein
LKRYAEASEAPFTYEPVFRGAPQAVRVPLTEAERASLDWLRTLATDKAMYQDRLGPIYKLIEGIVPLAPQDSTKEGGK